VIDGESKGGDCDEVMRTGGGEQNKVGGMKKRADSSGKVMHI